MQFSNTFVIIYFTGVLFSFILNEFLEYADYRYRKIHGHIVPQELTDYMTADDLARTCAYEDAKYKLWIPSGFVAAAIGVTLMVSGFYPYLFNLIWNITTNVYVTVLLFALCASIPEAVISLPFELYGEFNIEKKFGFSTMTFRLWFQDQVKSLIISIVIAVPLLLIMTALLEHTSWWWLLLGSVYVVFSLGMSIVYPLWIAPLFNKFTSLEDGELRMRVTTYLEKTGFHASGVFVMDASKRSNHSNAYFTGIGKSKRVVLYDTLVKQLSVDELGAVLGHELGHYKKHHIIKRLCVMIPLIFIVLFAVNAVINWKMLYTGFGFIVPDVIFPHMKFIGLFLLSESFGNYRSLAGLVGNYFSRRDEYAADRFSAELCGSGKPLCSALVKLNKENKSEITPPKIYSIFNSSHPTLLERIKAIE
jgi:STE24 endopeptidase